jgi:secreted Zn-dependent insulinase-like peptidase
MHDNALSPLCMQDNARITAMSQQFRGQTNEREHWFGTEYALEDIPADRLADWASAPIAHELHLPARNKFMATDFAILPAPGLDEGDAGVDAPCLVVSEARGSLWHKQDTHFDMPRANAQFALFSNAINSSPFAAAATQVRCSKLNLSERWGGGGCRQHALYNICCLQLFLWGWGGGRPQSLYNTYCLQLFLWV